MTTKFLTGAHPSGYSLSPAYTGLDVEAGASVGGTGVYAGFFATIQNDGAIDATTPYHHGISLHAGGVVTNGSVADTTALIEGNSGIYCGNGRTLTLANFGTIIGNVRYGVVLYGGSVTNGSASDTSALIEGTNNQGVWAGGPSSDTITNFGTIRSVNRTGVILLAGATVTNGSSTDTAALIAGVTGVGANATATLTNYGTIAGAVYAGLQWAGGGRVTNGSATDTTALIEGARGVFIQANGVSLGNFGTIEGGAVAGVVLQAAATVTNGSASDTVALIEGYIGIGEGSGGASTIANFGTILGATSSPNGAGLSFGNSAGTLINGSAADSSALIEGRSGVLAAGPLVTIINFGIIGGTGGTGGTAVQFASASDRLVAETGSAFDGLVKGGGGTLELAGGTGTIAGLGGTGTVAGPVALTFSGFGTYQLDAPGSWTLAQPNTVAAGRSLIDDGKVIDHGNLTLAGTISGVGSLSFTQGTSTIETGAAVSVANWSITGGDMSVNASLAYAGIFTEGGRATLGIGSGDTLSLSGAGSSLAALVVGAGTLAVTGGTLDVKAGAVLGMAAFTLAGGTTTLGEALTFGRTFSEGTAATLTLMAGDPLALTGSASLSGLIHGAGQITVSSATVSGLTLGGSVTLADAGAVVQTGAVTVGDTSAKAATLVIGAGATWTIEAGGIARGRSAGSILKVQGTLTDAAAGTTVIGVKIADGKSIVAATGTLDLTGALTGTGTLAIGAGATLEVGSSAAAGLTAHFQGANATLALSAPAQFAATIGGFAAGDRIHLLDLVAHGAVLGAGDVLTILQGNLVVATLQLSGDYSGDTFSAKSDGKGGTNITVSTAPAGNPPSAEAKAAHAFIAAAASVGVGHGGAAHLAFQAHAERLHSPLAAPRTQAA